MPETLWMNINTGSIACSAHGGSYLRAERAAHPRRRNHSTPLGNWTLVTAADDAEFTAYVGRHMACETCGATIPAQP